MPCHARSLGVTGAVLDSPNGSRPADRRLAVSLAGLVAAIVVAVSTAANGSPVQTVADVAGAAATALPTGGSIDAPIGTASAGPAVPEARMDPVRAVTRGAPPLITLSGYRWPLPKARLTLPFGPSPWGSRIVDGEKFHDGIDLADVLRRPRRRRARRRRPRRAAPLRRAHGLGRRPRAVPRPARQEAALDHAADRRRHR